jgi:F-type H+-transporting ATPase subunit b
LSLISQRLCPAGATTMRLIAVAAFLVLAWTPAGAIAAEGGLINLDKSLLIQMVNFLVLLFILWKLLYKPLVAKMEERTAAIKRSLDEAQAARLEAQREREEHAQKLQAAYAEAKAIRETALAQAAEEQRKLVEAARGEAARLVADARTEMEQDVRRARQELRQEISDLAVAVAERLVRKSLREPDHRRIVDEEIGQLQKVG